MRHRGKIICFGVQRSALSLAYLQHILVNPSVPLLVLDLQRWIKLFFSTFKKFTHLRVRQTNRWLRSSVLSVIWAVIVKCSVPRGRGRRVGRENGKRTCALHPEGWPVLISARWRRKERHPRQRKALEKDSEIGKCILWLGTALYFLPSQGIWPWTSYLTSLSLCFRICKMGL